MMLCTDTKIIVKVIQLHMYKTLTFQNIFTLCQNNRFDMHDAAAAADDNDNDLTVKKTSSTFSERLSDSEKITTNIL